MELDVFKKHFQKYIKEKGFKKNKNKYYLIGEKFICMIDLQRSYYGPTYYINYSFFLGKFENPSEINQESVETHTPYVGGRFYFAENHKYSCDYLDYTEEGLTAVLDDNFMKRIDPPFKEGENYLLKYYGTLYTSFLKDEIIRPLLES